MWRWDGAISGHIPLLPRGPSSVEMCAYLSGRRQQRGAPTAAFKSHFTPLRVKRPDTALSRGEGEEERPREGREGTRETGRKRRQRQAWRRRRSRRRGEREGHDVGEDERDGCWREATHSVWPRGAQGWHALKKGRERWMLGGGGGGETGG